MDELKKYLDRKKRLVEGSLKGYLKMGSASPKLLESMGYSVFSECKRFRPILAIAAAEAAGGDERVVLPFACALELIHTYSLIHDDLPCMDDDDLRRGKPSNHKAFGEATAVLAGDALLTLAFKIASDPTKDIEPKDQLKVINVIADSAGLNGMVAGQMLDLDGEGKSLDIKGLTKIHLHKTGKLIQCATRIGAITAKANERESASLSDYGENLGLAFQITDDMLDFTGKVPGKNPKGDLKNAKSTFATILGLEKSREMTKEAVEKAIASLLVFGERASILKRLAEFVYDRVK